MTNPTIVWLDTETTGLSDRRRAWDVATIIRRPDEPDVEWQCFVDVGDLDLSYADPIALHIGRFWDRHPQARWVEESGGKVRLVPDAPRPLPLDGVLREREMLTVVAELTAGRAVVAGSNPAFDTGTLGPRMVWHGIAPGWYHHPLDVPGEARGWLRGRGGPAPWKTDQIAAACNVDPDRYERHTALGDCRMMRDLYDRTCGRWVPGPPRRCATNHAVGSCRPPVVMVDGEPRCESCAADIDPGSVRRQPLPDRLVIR